MPREIIDADGNKVSVPTQEELDALSSAAKRAEQLEADKKAAEEKWAAEKQELEEQVNPNWRVAREELKRYKKLEADLKARGQKIDDTTASIVDDKGGLSPDEAKRIAAETASEVATRATIEAEVDRHLAKYSKDTADVVRHFFTKLTAGEKLTPSSIASYMDQAQRAAGAATQAASNSPGSYAGRAPRFSNTANELTEADLAIAARFGHSKEELQKGGTVSPFGYKK